VPEPIFRPVLDDAALTNDSAEVVEVGERKVALARCGGKVHALDNSCPHTGGPLGRGTVKDGKITCPLHHWTFDLETGKCVEGVAWEKVKVYPCRVQDGKIEIELKL